MAWTTPDATKVTGYTVTATDWDSMEANLAWIATESAGDLFLGVASSAPIYKAIPPVDNLLANSDKAIWQAGTGPFNVNGAGTTTDYCADRYVMVVDGSDTMAANRVTNSDTSTSYDQAYAIEIVYTKGSGTAPVCKQILKVADELSYLPKQLSYRVRVKSTQANSIYAYVTDNNGNQTNSSANTTTGWETLSVTNAPIKVDGSTSAVDCGIALTASCTVEIGWDVLVPWSAPVSYQPMNQAQSLLRCQRYYEKQGWGNYALYYSTYASGSNEIACPMTFQAYKTPSVTPTITMVGTWTLVNATVQPTIKGQTNQGYSLAMTATGAGMVSFRTTGATTYVLAKAYP